MQLENESAVSWSGSGSLSSAVSGALDLGGARATAAGHSQWVLERDSLAMIERSRLKPSLRAAGWLLWWPWRRFSYWTALAGDPIFEADA
jgi:hypothetical protein